MKALKSFNPESFISGLTSKIDFSARKLLFYVFDYRQYRILKDEEYSSSMEVRNQKYLRDQAEIESNIEGFVLKNNWDLHVEGHQSSLKNTFNFKSDEELNFFLNRAKPIAEELNHHPDWEILQNNKLKINLSTHDLSNTVGVKDYELASRLTLLYSDEKFLAFKNRRLIDNISGVFLLFAGFGLLGYFYSYQYHYLKTSRDFILSDITGYRKVLYRNTYGKSPDLNSSMFHNKL